MSEFSKEVETLHRRAAVNAFKQWMFIYQGDFSSEDVKRFERLLNEDPVSGDYSHTKPDDSPRLTRRSRRVQD